MDLLFERFLSEERGEWPDIDLDLPSGDQREKVIQHVYQRYGQRGAAMTANVCTYRGRSAAREMGKVLGFDEDTLSRLSAVVGTWEWRDPNDTTGETIQQTGLDISQPQRLLCTSTSAREYRIAASSQSAFGRDDRLSGPTRCCRSPRTCHDAREGRGSVGQRRLCRSRADQNGSARLGNDGGALKISIDLIGDHYRGNRPCSSAAKLS